MILHWICYHKNIEMITKKKQDSLKVLKELSYQKSFLVRKDDKL